ncbi:unnamed protein product [Ectocarpus sp. 12 AP-2014]
MPCVHSSSFTLAAHRAAGPYTRYTHTQIKSERRSSKSSRETLAHSSAREDVAEKSPSPRDRFILQVRAGRIVRISDSGPIKISSGGVPASVRFCLLATYAHAVRSPAWHTHRTLRGTLLCETPALA